MTQDYNFEEDDDAFKDRLIPWLRALVLLIALGIGGFLWGKPLYAAYKVRRGLAKVPAIESAMKSGNFNAASIDMRMALVLAPGEPEVWRLAARFCAATGSPDGLGYWERLADTPDFSREERLEFVEYAHRMGRVDLVAKHLTVLLADKEVPPRIWRLAVGHLRGRGEVLQAVAAARSWLERDPLNEEAQFGLGETALQHPDVAVRKEGRGLLWTMAVGKGGDGAACHRGAGSASRTEPGRVGGPASFGRGTGCDADAVDEPSSAVGSGTEGGAVGGFGPVLQHNEPDGAARGCGFSGGPE